MGKCIIRILQNKKEYGQVHPTHFARFLRYVIRLTGERENQSSITSKKSRKLLDILEILKYKSKLARAMQKDF